MTFSILLSALCLLLATATPAYAYLDPGTGSMLLSALVGIVATLFFLLKGIYYKGTGFIYSLLGMTKKRKSESIVFWSEGKNYWNTFRPVVEALSARGESCTYLSSDADDPGLQCGLAYVSTRYIGTGNKAFSTLNMLEADIVALTTPGLDVLQIRRSPGVKHYTHIVHAISDMAIYKLYSFDYYDSILCSGPYQMKSLRALEKIRHTGTKTLLESGCPYFDVMMRELQQTAEPAATKEQQGKLTILVAPTWNTNGLLSRFGMDLLEPLARSGHSIIIRPHPQSRKVEQALLAGLMEQLASYKNVVWDTEVNGLPAMKKADVLVSDFSGVVFDFAFVLEKPVLTISFDLDLRGLDGNDLPWPAWELGVLDILGKQLDAQDIPKIPEIAQALAADADFLPRLRELKEKSVWHFGSAGPVIAEQLLQIRNSLHPQACPAAQAAQKK